MAQAFFVFCVVAFLGLVVFVKFEVRTIVLFRYSERSMLAKYAVKVARLWSGRANKQWRGRVLPTSVQRRVFAALLVVEHRIQQHAGG